MDSPIFTATWQAGALSALSNILAQVITCYRSNTPFTLNTTDLAHFMLFAVLVTPPNFIWQSWLEAKFPAYTSKATANSKRSDEKSPDKSSQQLNIRNTAIKFFLDQTLGASVNTVLFIGGMGLLRGQSQDAIVQGCKQETWPLMLAGYKLWPLVSILNFTVVPMEFRMTVGSFVGLLWGVYLSMISGAKAHQD